MIHHINQKQCSNDAFDLVYSKIQRSVNKTIWKSIKEGIEDPIWILGCNPSWSLVDGYLFDSIVKLPNGVLNDSSNR